MAALSEVVKFLDNLLSPDLFQDLSLNGLQVEGGKSEVQKVALAVDAGLSVIERATEAHADLLLVHHGFFWGEALAVAGPHGKKIATLLKHTCSLYASHLPLDAHLEVGNAAELARFFGLTEIEPFFEYRGTKIGVKAAFKSALPLEDFVNKAALLSPNRAPLVLPFGKPTVRSVGIVTGSGSSALGICALEGLDLLISGEPRHEAYHRAKELSINAIFAGHYATETFGVRALGAKLEQSFKIKTVFIEEDSGI